MQLMKLQRHTYIELQLFRLELNYLCSVVEDWWNKHTKTSDALPFANIGLEIFCSHLLTNQKEALRDG